MVSAPSIVGETLDALPRGPTAAGTAPAMCACGFTAARCRRCPTRGCWRRQCRGGSDADGAWEILQFANAELVDETTYLLSRLLRGQAGSEWAMAAHCPRARRSCCSTAYRAGCARLDALARPMQLRIVAAGLNHDDPAAVELTVTPGDTALKPLSPVHVALSGKATAFTSRGSAARDRWRWLGVEVPLGEESEAYTVDILSGSSVLRSIASATPRRSTPTPTSWPTSARTQSSLHLRVGRSPARSGGICGGSDAAV